MNWFPGYNYILASKSPRRQQLLKLLGMEFQVRIKEVDETIPSGLSKLEIPVHLALLKSRPFLDELTENELLVTADTIVWLDNNVLGKPANAEEAAKMLRMLSDNEHQVITGVCLSSAKKQKTFYSITNVRFKKLMEEEILYYVNTFQPFDKAGAYGIQEWIGVVGIKQIEGSYYNVMGLPVQKLYEEIIHF